MAAASSMRERFGFRVTVMSRGLLAGTTSANHLGARRLGRLDPQVQQRSQIKRDTCQPYHGWRQRPRSFQQAANFLY
jgi:hypothetical protein